MFPAAGTVNETNRLVCSPLRGASMSSEPSATSVLPGETMPDLLGSAAQQVRAQGGDPPLPHR